MQSTASHTSSPTGSIAPVRLSTAIDFSSDSNFVVGFDPRDPGVFVATYGCAPVGSVVELLIALPYGYVIRTLGRVGWLRGLGGDTSPGMGIELDAPDARARMLMQAFMQHRMPLFHA